ncbi:MAG TPA: single-stranded-DNA-specific exonuclease RecJ [Herpetosiphon sp.]|uniref:Single-stranded-DNA-specific exonuclease RecJ n=1 Tax=Herpetosiphon aurantiacus (strain ATCC 23779 / DSM 785 / 114-95) TaxID=316274 RepID=A9B300_HERA2|nr:single-stranded-DNA-specific exonuclease RecJ [Herpetosiphon sp.]ABX07463.1 single-stranded-DNA-specific exonuclease RecJ [Herpetosiphon aurantiacus DSM 785]HBW49149.1 single-stranded-DNA-specific exonuclease RecJ [Herpetosiphon sp.]
MLNQRVMRHWQLPTSASPSQLRSLGEYHPLLAAILWNRGWRDAAAVEQFLNIDWKQRHDPFLLHDMDRAVERIKQAVAQQQRVVVYGDFDTDGVTGVTLLMQLFKAFGLPVRPYIPKREGEGYGLNLAAIEKLHQEGLDLLVTVDCGISNVAEISRANELGFDTIVLDHHQPPANLPPAYAVVDPKRSDCAYPFKGLCGVGVAFKLYEALWRAGIQPNNLRARDILDVVALGTIADMMPLTGENRVLVHFGLQAMNESQRPGLKALLRVAGVEQGKIDASSVGFRLSPRINAAGRLVDARIAYSLLLAPDQAQADGFADQLNSTNIERQALTRDVQQAARELAQNSGQLDQRILVIVGEDFHHGVVGLAAGKLAEEFARPVLVMGKEEDRSRGSARSIPGFNIVNALAECADLFEKYGGHAAAAGFTIANEHIPELEQRLQAIANQQITDAMMVPQLPIDAEATFDQLNLDTLAVLEKMAPFGLENPQPRFCSRRVTVIEARGVGAENQHLRLRLQQGRHYQTAIGFNLGDWLAELPNGSQIDIVYTVGINEWNGRSSVQLTLVDLRLSEGQR